ncbi:polyprenyl synthetase family protein [Streptomyces alkaliphilus]|uniref:Polyprenyl synthetase family protein n=1 Tax=Streptomyces alkaliphilus TaxID=1472722 RepID=A0A7W3TCE6_9ACTN|nr:polyprenyl synthetase family protein [Streptomyces alkaliphilus]
MGFLVTAEQLYEAPIPASPDGRLSYSSVLLSRLGPNEPAFRLRMEEALAAAERCLREYSRDSSDPRVADLTGHLATTGGKRLRTLLALLAAEFGDPAREGVVRAAVVAELVHIASLYHDDVVDRAAVRHGVSSANVLWGDRMAVLGGNWLLARAARIAAELEPGVIDLNAGTANRLITGQMRELAGPGPEENPVEHYFRVIAGKTAALLAMAPGAGALQAGAPEAVVDALIEYGEQFGVAFQIADDLLDIASPESLTGKERGKDLLAGVSSLPVLLALEDTDPRDAELRELLAAGPGDGTDRHLRVLELFAVSRATARAEAIMRERLAGARAALESLPATPARHTLDALCDFVAFRTG